MNSMTLATSNKLDDTAIISRCGFRVWRIWAGLDGSRSKDAERAVRDELRNLFPLARVQVDRGYGNDAMCQVEKTRKVPSEVKTEGEVVAAAVRLVHAIMERITTP